MDPLVKADSIAVGVKVELSRDELEAADLVVVLTDHDELDWDLVLSHGRLIFDTRNRLKGDHVQRL